MNHIFRDPRGRQRDAQRSVLVQRSIITQIELVNPASFVFLGNQRLFGAGTPLHCGKQWVMIIVAYREEIQLYCFSTATCLQEPLSSGWAALDSVFFCVQITRFVCIFSIFLLCFAPSRPFLRPMLWGKPSSVCAACSWVSLPGFCHTLWFQINTLGMYTKAGTNRSCK